ncbi:hypothetical protein V1T76_00095 [Roseibium sp. FZY0029]|uniref:hypothetical protein n=1 Tax=Roseibium sp. FZY0029 TaxID=3116647 RepID=UPI002EC312E1|nr:hypothetical protein [Roseibium sp. FZY0029]
MPMVTRQNSLSSGRLWALRLIAGLMSVVAVSLLIAAPATVLADNWSMAGISIVLCEIIVLAAGLAWLAHLIFVPER